MAIMYPSNQTIFPNESEKQMYERLRDELPNDVRVYYSIAWNSDAQEDQYMGEGDFVVLDPNFGFIVLEVKGGYKIEVDGNRWTLWETISTYRHLNKSPYEQARTSMHTFIKKYTERYNELLPATCAFAVCFPHYNVSKDVSLEINTTNTINQKDISNGKLRERLRSIFFAHKKNGVCPDSVVERLDTMFRGVRYSNISTGNVITSTHLSFQKLNYFQDACIDFLANYNQVMIVGSAGTGKTFMAMQKALMCAKNGLRTLYVCYNRLISQNVERMIGTEGVHCYTFHKYVSSVLRHDIFQRLTQNGDDLKGVLEEVSAANPQKYDAIIVDEAQDFSEEWALVIRMLLADENNSILYVFYDEEQNIFKRNFGEAFLIDGAPFVLRRNIRNTENIWNYVKDKTRMGCDSYSSGVIGTDPKYHPVKKTAKLIESITKVVRTITDEGVNPSQIVILSDRRYVNTPISSLQSIANYAIIDATQNEVQEDNAIRFFTIQSYKGLDSDVVIVLVSSTCNDEMRYVAYSRARCLLYVYEFSIL